MPSVKKITRFGTKQVKKTTPRGWKNFENAFLLAVAPGFTTFLMTALPEGNTKTISLAAVVLVGSLIKGIGIFLGTEIQITPDEEEDNGVVTNPDGTIELQ